jgi:putative NADH-flavin reductase
MRIGWLAAIAFLALGAQAQELRPGLQILVYGATGNIGAHIVDEALARGHFVTAVSRDPTRIEKQHPNLTAAAGDLLDPGSIEALVVGKDVVVTSVRGVIGDDAGRLVHVGGSGSLEVGEGKLYADTLPKIFLPKNLELEIEGQILALEYLRAVEDVEWSYATPPKNFTNGERTGNFRVGGDQLLEDERGKSRLSRADFAVAVLDEIELEKHTGKRFSVAY